MTAKLNVVLAFCKYVAAENKDDISLPPLPEAIVSRASCCMALTWTPRDSEKAYASSFYSVLCCHLQSFAALVTRPFAICGAEPGVCVDYMTVSHRNSQLV